MSSCFSAACVPVSKGLNTQTEKRPEAQQACSFVDLWYGERLGGALYCNCYIILQQASRWTNTRATDFTNRFLNSKVTTKKFSLCLLFPVLSTIKILRKQITALKRESKKLQKSWNQNTAFCKTLSWKSPRSVHYAIYRGLSKVDSSLWRTRYTSLKVHVVRVKCERRISKFEQ